VNGCKCAALFIWGIMFYYAACDDDYAGAAAVLVGAICTAVI